MNGSSNQSCYGNVTSPCNHGSVYSIPVHFVVAFFVIILLVNAIGNAIVVSVILSIRRMRTFTNCMILNLAFTDLSVALMCVPLEIPLEINHQKWIYGRFFCYIFYPLQSATIYGSVFTLVALSFSRYWAILHPYRRQPTKYVAKILICTIWITSVLLVTPYMMALRYDSAAGYCQEIWGMRIRRIYTIVTFTLQYMLPLLIIIVAYAFIIYEMTMKKKRRKSYHVGKDRSDEGKKLIRLLLIITITFGICVLPYHVVALSIEFGDGGKYEYIEDISLGSYLLLYLNSALNPLIYTTFSSNFREMFSESYKRFVNYTCKSRVYKTREFSTRRVKSTMVSYSEETEQLKTMGTT